MEQYKYYIRLTYNKHQDNILMYGYYVLSPNDEQAIKKARYRAWIDFVFDRSFLSHQIISKDPTNEKLL